MAHEGGPAAHERRTTLDEKRPKMAHEWRTFLRILRIKKKKIPLRGIRIWIPGGILEKFSIISIRTRNPNG